MRHATTSGDGDWRIEAVRVAHTNTSQRRSSTPVVAVAATALGAVPSRRLRLLSLFVLALIAFASAPVRVAGAVCDYTGQQMGSATGPAYMRGYDLVGNSVTTSSMADPSGCMSFCMGPTIAYYWIWVSGVCYCKATLSNDGSPVATNDGYYVGALPGFYLASIPVGAKWYQYCPPGQFAQVDYVTCPASGGTIPVRPCTLPCSLTYATPTTAGLQYVADLDWGGSDLGDSGSTVYTQTTCNAWCTSSWGSSAVAWLVSAGGRCYCKSSTSFPSYSTNAAGITIGPTSAGTAMQTLRNGTVVRMTCPSGYTSNGGTQRVCLSGSFTGTAFSCTPSPCTLSYSNAVSTGLNYISGYDFGGSDLAYSLQGEYMTAQSCYAWCASAYPVGGASGTAKMWLLSYNTGKCYCKFATTQAQTSVAYTILAGPMPGNTLPNLAIGSLLKTECATGYSSTGATSQTCSVGAYGGAPFVCADVNECASLNGGCDSLTVCTNTAGSRTCSACPAGYTSSSGSGSTTCIQQCASNPCTAGNTATCSTGNSSWSCVCNSGYSGLTCQTNINECASNPCLNGGSCIDGVNGWSCKCVAGYSGLSCQTNINECASIPCLNGGTCSDAVDGFRCACPGGFSGLSCQTNINECASVPCANGGTCVDQTNRFVCTCVAGFSGLMCQANINECASSPCTVGQCLDRVNGYACGCPSGFQGSNCQTNINECASLPCTNGGTCTDMTDGYSCACVNGYSGANCQTNINECASQPCYMLGVASSACVDALNSYACQCNPGWSGLRCQTDVNECASQPCVNGGTCVDATNQYSCVCPAGYSGANCQTNVNECASNPCLNSATCVDSIGSWSCQCVPGYSGIRCETEIYECASSPCVHGTCNDRIAGFNCTCISGVIGVTCDTDVNECATDNGGCNINSVCTNSLGGYTCTPYLIPNSLFSPESGATAGAAGVNILFGSTAAGHKLRFNISVVAAPAVLITVGPASNPLQFQCGSLTYLYGSATNYRAECTLQAATGTDLLFGARNSDSSVVASQISETVNFGAPTIKAGTIRRNDAGYDSIPDVTLVLDTNNAATIRFNGTNFYGPLMNVTYGSEEGNALGVPYSNYTCAIISEQTTDTQVTCKTAIGSFGTFLNFHVAVAGRGTNGTDFISFPVVPSISSISGCDPCPDAPYRTCNCPTAGKIRVITIFGRNFFQESLQVKVNGLACESPLAAADSRSLTCTLPEGAGLLRSVTVTCNQFTSIAQKYVSYASPSITTLTFGGAGSAGCIQSGPRYVSNCPTSGGTVLTLTGTNFGPRGAVVLIGAAVCLSVTQDATTPHQLLTCTTPSSVGVGSQVLLLQYGGLLANDSAPIFDYHQCKTGEWLNSTDLSCNKCDAGQISNVPDAQKCSSCKAGFYPNPTSSECIPCDPGSVSSGGTALCSNCTAGYYMPNTGQASCLPCALGRYAAGNGTITCSECPAGSVQPEHGKSTCVLCDIGSAESNPGQTGSTSAPYCPQCSSGSFSNETGLAQCLSCPPGTYQPSPGQSECLGVEVGYYTDSPASTAPLPCGLGTYSNSTNSTTCAYCEAGTAQPNTHQSTCDICGPGTYAGEPHPLAPNEACTLCVPGTASELYAATSCVACDEGYYQNSAGQYNCKPALAGQYVNEKAQGYVRYCAAGRYAGSYAQTDCTDCEAGTYQSDSGASACSVCVGGQYTPEPIPGSGSNKYFANCKAGTYSGDHASECTPCDVGRYSNAGSSACTDCAAGTFSLGNVQSCTACPRGYFASENATVQCTPCPAGSHATDYGQSYCAICDAGSFGTDPSPAYVNKDCAQCGPGTFSAQNASACSDCLAGSYSLPNAGSCTPCEKGKFVSTPNADSCGFCSAGHYANTTGNSVCTKCPAGTYVSSSGATRCLDCAAGTYSSQPSDSFPNIICTPAPQGAYVPKNGSTASITCDPGYYQTSTGSSQCSACDPGTYSATSGFANYPCTLCTPGFEANSAGSSECQICTPGRYSAVTATSRCHECEAGRYSAQEGATACLSCAAGTYTNVSGLHHCTLCSAPYVTGVSSGASSCGVLCTGTVYQKNDGQSGCSQCALQSYYDGDQCQTCPVGSTCSPTTGGIAGVNGYFVFTNDDGKLQSLTCASCVTCPSGSVSSQVANTSSGVKASTVYSCCATNYAPADTNPLCGSCAPGYNHQGDECIECDEANAPYVLALMAISWGYVIAFHLLSQDSTADTRIFLNYIQFVYLFLSAQAGSLTSWMALFNLNIFQATGASCVAPMTDLERLSSGLFIPVVGLVFLMATCLLHYISFRFCGIRNQHCCLPDQLNQKPQMDFSVVWRSYRRSSVGFLASSYPSICQTVFTFFSCVEYEGDSYIISYPSISCTQNTDYLRVYYFFVVMMILVASAPILLFARLWFLNRDGHLDHSLKLDEQPDEAIVYGILTETYKADLYGWECFVLIRRMVIAAVILAPQFYSDAAAKFTWLSLCTIIFLTVHFYKMPYSLIRDNQAEALGELTLIVLTLFLVSAPVPLTAIYAGGLSAMCFVVAGLFILRMIFTRIDSSVTVMRRVAADMERQHPRCAACLNAVATVICCGSTTSAADDIDDASIEWADNQMPVGSAASPGPSAAHGRTKTVSVKPRGDAGGSGDELAPVATATSPVAGASSAVVKAAGGAVAVTGSDEPRSVATPAQVASTRDIELASFSANTGAVLGATTTGPGGANQLTIAAAANTTTTVTATGTTGDSPQLANRSGAGMRARRSNLVTDVQVPADDAPPPPPPKRSGTDSVPITPLPPLQVAGQPTPPLIAPPPVGDGTSTPKRSGGKHSGSGSGGSSGKRSGKLPPLTPGGTRLQNPFEIEPLPGTGAATAAATRKKSSPLGIPAAGAPSGSITAAGATGGGQPAPVTSGKDVIRRKKSSPRTPVLLTTTASAPAPTASTIMAAVAAAATSVIAPPAAGAADLAVTVLPTPPATTPKAVDWSTKNNN